MKFDEIKDVIKSLAKSQGLYGRILDGINELPADKLDVLRKELEDQNFNDPVDVIMYFEG
jgi:hypothetical protein